MRIIRISLFVCLVYGSLLAGGCHSPATAEGAKPQLSPSQQKEMTEKSKQAEIDMRTDQINRSNLPPEQKQRLLEQIRPSTAK